MADTNNTNQTGGSGAAEEVTFAPDPKLEADAAGAAASADIEFEPAEGLAEPKKSTTDALKEQAGRLGTQAADQARAFAGQGKDRATSALDEVARMMESAAGDVDAKLGEEYGRYARSAAQGITGFADALRGKEVDDLISDATELVRKSPVIAVGAAAAVGFVLARLIKSGIDAAADLGEAQSGGGETTGNA